ncbi:MAG: acylneuraminate cytidylyltransferase family protein [Nitrospirae bacterium]|nr:acylneuraminate cytidylyltransferase family protein [Nitrospirota bacterium]
MTSRPTIVALIPARAGSKRVPGKNVRLLAGHPLIAYTIASAVESGVFSDVVISTDSEATADVARHYGAEVPFLRPPEFAGDLSPDIEWVEHALQRLKGQGRAYDAFSILRPTSPFRNAATIRRAWNQFSEHEVLDSLRAVELCGQHPGKMWVLRGMAMVPLLPNAPEDPPWHSMPYQALPPVYVQNASLEMAWSRVVFTGRSIAGKIIAPFITEGVEGFDINGPWDWWIAEEMIRKGDAKLPDVLKEPFRAHS